MTSEEPLDTLPPVIGGKTVATTRQMQIRLSTETFLKLEMDAARRGLTSYKLASVVLTMYLNGKLVQKKELTSGPETNQQTEGGTD
ncbi:hypothetical protein [Methylomonas methanica]|uniref:Uncharacterized protein n=1 Tax=Methylomonas methanica (strain DSM 25384 / MC09) TaxID=857087 RepID=F9ZV48_METMM|nr:hypothetical protein [Methylomonas methanica]AEF99481.1 hypothetical protein Metme_1045 [Methylomonas methanica MC09]